MPGSAARRDRAGRSSCVGRAERAGDGAGVADQPGQAAGVDAGDARDAVAHEHRVEVGLGAPVARPPRQLAHDDAAAEQPGRLEVGGVDAVVADVRVGERDDLAGVARVGEDLLVAGQRRVEHDLARRRRRRRRRRARPRTPSRRRARARRAVGCSCVAVYVHSSLRRPVDDDRVAAEHRVADLPAQVDARRTACCGCGWRAPPGGPASARRGRTRRGWRRCPARSARRGGRRRRRSPPASTTARRRRRRAACRARRAPRRARSPGRASRAGRRRAGAPCPRPGAGRGRWRWRRSCRRRARPSARRCRRPCAAAG